MHDICYESRAKEPGNSMKKEDPQEHLPIEDVGPELPQEIFEELMEERESECTTPYRENGYWRPIKLKSVFIVQ